jgi:hypothetical protein
MVYVYRLNSGGTVLKMTAHTTIFELSLQKKKSPIIEPFFFLEGFKNRLELNFYKPSIKK